MGVDDQRATNIVTGITIMASVIFYLFLFARFIPAFVSIPVEENISLKKSWLITEGNTSRLLLTMLLISLPALLINAIIFVLLGLAHGLMTGQEFPQSVLHAGIWTSLGFLLLSPITAAGGALWIAAKAIVYRDLVPQPEHLVDVTV